MTIHKITLDSNIWREQLFLDWLQSDSNYYREHVCPIIIFLETSLWYDMKGLTRHDLLDELEKLKTKVILFDEKHVENVIKITRKSKLPFKHHARDFMIEAIVLEEKSTLITFNTDHFTNLPKNQLLTPREFINLNLRDKDILNRKH